MLDGLAFANGVALAADESYVAVAETGARTVVRHWLTGPRAGQRDHLATDLPGYPDNIARGSDGLIWVTIASPRDPLVERLQSGPTSGCAARSPGSPSGSSRSPSGPCGSRRTTTPGTLVHDARPPKSVHRDDFHMVTGVREHDGRVWMGSLEEPAVAVLSL